MKGNGRTFTLSTSLAVRKPRRLMLEITGSTGAGKTKSALELATGMQRVVGGDIRLLDTDSGRASLYAEKYKFFHEDLSSPYSPLDYLAMLQAIERSGATITIVDQMSYEHNGPGGMLDWHEAEVQRMAGNDRDKAERVKGLAWSKPKAGRRALKDWILASKMHFIFCYRAAEKMKWEPGKAPEKMGWKEDSTSDLPFEMDARFLLEPGADGVPTFFPENKHEKARTKNPEYFRPFFNQGMTLNAELGERMARWAQAGGATAATPAKVTAPVATGGVGPAVGAGEVFRFPSGEYKGQAISDADVSTDYLVGLRARTKDKAWCAALDAEIAKRNRHEAGEVDDVPPLPEDGAEASQ